MTSAAIYTRQSLDKSGEGAGVARQREACEQLAQAKDIASPQLFEDNDRSASSGPRPEFERLLQEVEAGRVTTILVFHLDRLTRSVRDLVRITEAGKEHGLNIACVHGVSVDLGDPTGVAVATILASIAAMEVQHKGKRQQAANKQRAAQGTPHWVRRPFGLDRRGNAVHIVQEEAEALREAAARIIKGEPIRAIVRDFNQRGLTSTEGNPLSSRTLQRNLLSAATNGRRLYKGELVDVAKGKEWPVILDKATQDEIATILADPKRKTAPDDNDIKHLLSGIMICGKCGKKTYAGSTRGRAGEELRRVYKCHGGYCTVRAAAPVEELIRAVIVARLSDPEVIKSMPQRGTELRVLRHELGRLRERHEGLTEMLADGLLPLSKGREQAARLTTQMSQLEERISSLELASPLDQIAAADDVAKAWDSTPLGDQRRIIRVLMDIRMNPASRRSHFEPSDIAIEWRQ